LRNDIKNQFQEVTKTRAGVSDALNERIDAHVVASRKVRDRISEGMNARSRRLLDDMKDYRIEQKIVCRNSGKISVS
jgi:hypothetical protein